MSRRRRAFADDLAPGDRILVAQAPADSWRAVDPDGPRPPSHHHVDRFTLHEGGLRRLTLLDPLDQWPSTVLVFRDAALGHELHLRPGQLVCLVVAS